MILVCVQGLIITLSTFNSLQSSGPVGMHFFKNHEQDTYMLYKYKYVHIHSRVMDQNIYPLHTLYPIQSFSALGTFHPLTPTYTMAIQDQSADLVIPPFQFNKAYTQLLTSSMEPCMSNYQSQECQGSGHQKP